MAARQQTPLHRTSVRIHPGAVSRESHRLLANDGKRRRHWRRPANGRTV